MLASRSLGSLLNLGELSGGLRSSANGINDNGQVVGYSGTSGTTQLRATLYENGTRTSLGTLPNGTVFSGGYSSANDISNNGVVVGSSYYQTNTFNTHAFKLDLGTGTMTDLGALPGDASSQANSINTSGQIVGTSAPTASSTAFRAFYYNNGSMTKIGDVVTPLLPSNNLSMSTGAINDNAQVIGTATSGTILNTANNYVYLYSGQNNTATLLSNTIGGISTTGQGININGDIVGASWNGSANRGYIYKNGQMQDLNSLIALPAGWTLLEGRSINDAGQIVGVAATANFAQVRAFLLSPVQTVVPTGSSVQASAGGGILTPGGVDLFFDNVTSPGDFSDRFYQNATGAQLASQTAPFNFAVSADGAAQYWDLNFTGQFSGVVEVTFHYDPSALTPGINENDLLIYHFVNGAWIPLAGQGIDTSSDTIAGFTTSFSPFALGTVPEPATFGLLTMVATTICVIRRRIAR